MKLEVECYAGYKGTERPTRFRLGDRWLEVEEVTDRWYDPEAALFKVRVPGGDVYILRHDERSGEWSLAAYRRGGK